MGFGPAMAGGEPPSKPSPVSLYTSEETFEDVIENIKMAIIDRGMLVSGTLHVSEMLNRTGPDLGFSQVFSKAESVEFCSALISHKMSQAAPENIVICPFTIAVYVTEAEPQKVNVAYRLPLLAGDAKAATDAIVEMLDGIVQDSI
ncbi:MAG: hypothetical protein KZQ73_10545 [Candidatus Thiodiazotropha sp. (ex Semelilucina semeliformis)]|nr:hypothetical protein [Candidatus Thiodiazotropha sp. (ex Myrtea spinifera)]MCU7808290.1 hypothetical protein [Candidatus Thiodiazotropha sp. (ex Semelilucina semeliformis)]MCU7827815.1 hypothetical protein [Candidatus Thiodiazotropha sp. (ex Myrtea sp. 'scaly one' KF741663)]